MLALLPVRLPLVWAAPRGWFDTVSPAPLVSGVKFQGQTMWSALHTLLLPHLAPLAPSSSAQVACSFCSIRFPICPPLRLLHPWGQEHSPTSLLSTAAWHYPSLFLPSVESVTTGNSLVVHLYLFIHLPLAPCLKGIQFVARRLSPLH